MPRASARPRQSEPLDLPAVRRRLLAWYRRNARDLPWRHRQDDPYAVWLAEMMLQQTQAATVIPYYDAFLRRFPTVTALARADRAEILRLWAGLGYYRRAHHLHETARRIAFEFGGRFPEDVAGLLELPGVGRYTAGAIASIAYGRRAPILDGNVKRVLARLVASRASPDAPDEQRRLWELAEAILPRRSCGAFNQALMDLGATVCTPTSPRCDRCPVARNCTAFRQGATAVIPRPKRRPVVSEQHLVCWLIVAGEHVLLHRRAERGLWGGTWAPPTAEAGGDQALTAARHIVPQTIRRRVARYQRLGSVQHRLTHRAVTFDVRTGTTARIRLPAGFRWLPIRESASLPTAFRKVLALLTAAKAQRSRRAS